jgi:hypothetical protein
MMTEDEEVLRTININVKVYEDAIFRDGEFLVMDSASKDNKSRLILKKFGLPVHHDKIFFASSGLHKGKQVVDGDEMRRALFEYFQESTITADTNLANANENNSLILRMTGKSKNIAAVSSIHANVKMIAVAVNSADTFLLPTDPQYLVFFVVSKSMKSSSTSVVGGSAANNPAFVIKSATSGFVGVIAQKLQTKAVLPKWYDQLQFNPNCKTSDKVTAISALINNFVKDFHTDENCKSVDWVNKRYTARYLCITVLYGVAAVAMLWFHPHNILMRW